MIAGHRSARYARAGLVADLCCGIGGDLVALAAGRGVLAVDRDRLHLRMAQANAYVYGVAAGLSAVAADVREVSLRGVDAVFIDPARRAGGRRLRAGDSEPPLAWCHVHSQRLQLSCLDWHDSWSPHSATTESTAKRAKAAKEPR